MQRLSAADIQRRPWIAFWTGQAMLGVSEAVTMAITAPAWAPVVPFTLLILILVFWPERV